ncbi:hypothetical protein GCM10020366_63220 [Saccharopolyspora gregorii]|uniref:Uncharacterized protein n=1 Tax=Saccharopolyspora gregorii TaxID=33914 RepID=A0ABP6S0X6_9PSEU
MRPNPDVLGVPPGSRRQRRAVTTRPATRPGPAFAQVRAGARPRGRAPARAFGGERARGADHTSNL